MTSEKIDIPLRKTKEHDNDEGFEETQSLMSESPSQGASSGGNYENDTIDSSRIVVANSIKSPMKNQDKKTVAESHISTSKIGTLLVPKTGRTLDRSTSLRKNSQDAPSITKSIIPRRSESLRKPEQKQSIPKQQAPSIQKSNSRNSIVSSRSSLNSATSTCTVKKLPLKPNSSNNLSKPVQRSPSNKSVGPTTARSNLRRTSSNSSSISNKPPRPQGMSFMKPTASSSTKQINSVPTSRQKKI